MKKIIIFLFCTCSTFFFSQEREKSQKLEFYSSLDINVGLDLGDIIRNNRAKSDYEKQQLPPGKFNYGFSSSIGYQPLNWFSLNAGFRYSYIDPNYHLLYWTVQPNFFLGDHRDEDFVYLFANIGSKINQTASKNAGFIGVGAGKIEPINQHLGHKIQLYIENQVLDGEGNIFIGISYGIIIFSNKNL